MLRLFSLLLIFDFPSCGIWSPVKDAPTSYRPLSSGWATARDCPYIFRLCSPSPEGELFKGLYLQIYIYYSFLTVYLEFILFIKSCMD